MECWVTEVARVDSGHQDGDLDKHLFPAAVSAAVGRAAKRLMDA
jgi:hypothetical protein